LVKLGFIFRQEKVANQGEKNHYWAENTSKCEIIIVADRHKFWLLKPQKYSNCEVEVALNKERKKLLPNEVWLEFGFKPLA
jgi:hypothetical protein